MLVKNTTTHTYHTNITIHEELEVFLETLLGDRPKVDGTLYQKIVEKDVVYWSFMVTDTKSCDLLLRMRVERPDEDEVVVRVESVEEEGESRDEG